MAKLLIVDDDEAMRSVIRRLAERAGHSVTEAADGREALKSVCDNPPAVLITDIVMPDIEGIELIGRIRSKHPGLKIVAMSGGGRISPGCYLELAANIGAHATLEKPFEGRTLLYTIETVLNLP